MISRLIALGILLLMFTIMPFISFEQGVHEGGLAASLGLVILSGFLCGEIGSRLQLPRLTGYIVAGILIGPYVLGMLSHEVVAQLNLIDQIALAIIALSAGGELHLTSLRKRFRGIAWITGAQTVGIFSIGVLSFYLISSWMPFLQGLSSNSKLAVSLVFGVIAVAQSPATTIAIITETKSAGMVTETLLGITVIKDVLVIFLFSSLIPLLKMIEFDSGGMNVEFIFGLFYELGISIVAGLVAGFIISLYLRYVNQSPVLFVLAFSYLVSEGAKNFHLDTLIICIAAGVWVTNASKRGEDLIQMLEDSSLLVYVIFFTITGAALNLIALQTMFGFAVLLVVIRIMATGVSTYAGAKFSGETFPSPHWLWMLFLPQAGVSLGLLTVLIREGFAWSEGMQTLMIAVIAINQIVGPILMKNGLSICNEIGHAKRGRS